jgi:voltage-gated potassium channel
MPALVLGFSLMAVAVAIHLLGGFRVVLHLHRRLEARGAWTSLFAVWVLVELFAALLALHLMQVGLWALLYWWRIGWDFNTALYFSAVTYATIGYGDVVPPPQWRLVAVTEGLTGVLMLGWSSALIFAVVASLFEHLGRVAKGPPG